MPMKWSRSSVVLFSTLPGKVGIVLKLLFSNTLVYSTKLLYTPILVASSYKVPLQHILKPFLIISMFFVWLLQ